MKNSFISRWSQRKLDSEQEESLSSHDVVNEVIEADGSVHDAPESSIETQGPASSAADVDEEALNNNIDLDDNAESALDDDVAVESLSMSELMSKTGLDKAAKKAALRKMFLSPEFNVVDRLNDYDHDYASVKPLAAGVADTLRQWINKVEELDADEEVEETETQTPELLDDSGNKDNASFVGDHADESCPLKGDNSNDSNSSTASNSSNDNNSDAHATDTEGNETLISDDRSPSVGAVDRER
ncbi:hypothetical protein BCU70_11915 [Vibrio sp. 10N.286.49.C2]|uniref:DUF3306 domain-containing protein n=1 Tax=unclassified Vibrio TaxID=2614977 RepID=UPI000CB1DAA3|nr:MULTISPECIES: DUF3306 domain-containing protein [unclassified Vibrio]PMH40048.1 hypothetical protein BCU70_11915 [Vibrio sp. 10N.286.49.C2]PMH52177.1 hypothetical protein BCU66_16340 [Vibrio sp. 10N.286.49.B1]PMH79241.1 hypothetical protein BCU58_06075 [Vibrio sp. 10N.286.48.B7]